MRVIEEVGVVLARRIPGLLTLGREFPELVFELELKEELNRIGESAVELVEDDVVVLLLLLIELTVVDLEGVETGELIPATLLPTKSPAPLVTLDFIPLELINFPFEIKFGELFSVEPTFTLALR